MRHMCVPLFPVVYLSNFLVCEANSSCNGRGECNATNGDCVCNEGFEGGSCGQCEPNLFGPDCDICMISML